MSGQAAAWSAAEQHTLQLCTLSPLHTLLPKRWHQCEHPATQAQLLICDADQCGGSALLTRIMK